MNKLKLTLIIVATIVAAIVGFKYFTTGSISSLIQEKDFKTKGNPQASIKIVEFLDFECPACAVGALFLKEYMEQNPDKIYLTLKYYPLDMHKHSLVAAAYVQCAGLQGKFWEYQDYILKEQEKWSKLENAKVVFDFITTDIGLDKAKMTQCVDDPKTVDYILKIKAEGKTLKLRSTPTYYVNGEMVVGKFALEEKLKTLTDAAKTH